MEFKNLNIHSVHNKHNIVDNTSEIGNKLEK